MRILHSDPPSSAVSWDADFIGDIAVSRPFTERENPSPVKGLVLDQDLRKEGKSLLPKALAVSAVGLNPDQRAILLKKALEALEATEATHASITIYTGIPTSDSEAPCGCTGYDDVCWYHRYREDVAECYCSQKYQTLCDYHATITNHN